MAMPSLVSFKNLGRNDKYDKSKKNKEKEATTVKEVCQKQGFILDDISKFIDYWKGGIDRCIEYAKCRHNVVQYWSRIRELIDEVPK